MNELTPENPPKTDGDVRRLILETIMGVRDGSLDVSQGAVMAQNFKELNANMSNSINLAKLALNVEATGRKFVNTIRLGQQEVSGETEAPQE